MRDIIIDFQNSDMWKTHLTVAISSISSKDVDEEHLMYAISDNVELISYDHVNDIDDKLFESLHSRYQGNSETSMERSRINSSCFQNWNTVKSCEHAPSINTPRPKYVTQLTSQTQGPHIYSPSPNFPWI